MIEKNEKSNSKVYDLTFSTYNLRLNPTFKYQELVLNVELMD